MLEWQVEIRRHGRFFGFCLGVLAALLALHLLMESELSAVVWVFGVLLVSATVVAYVVIRAFTLVVREADVLMRMSTQSEAKKFLLQILPLAVGMLLVGAVTLGGYLVATGAAAGSDAEGQGYLYAVVAKAASVVAFVALVWLLARVVRRVMGLSVQMLLFGVLLAALVGAQVLAIWMGFGLGGRAWSVGVSSEYVGLPTYFNVVPVMVGDAATWEVTTAMWASVALNVAVSVGCVAAELIAGRRGRDGHRAESGVPRDRRHLV